MNLDDENDSLIPINDDKIKIIKDKQNIVQQLTNDGDFFVREQFNEHYKDTINAFNLIAGKEVIFDGTIGGFADAFISIINNSKNDNADWQSLLLPEQKIQSGWDKQMKNLGLPPSLYDERFEKNPIRLIKLGKLRHSDIDYSLTLLVKKKGVYDKLLITVTMRYINKNKVIIGNVFIDGFYTKILQ